MKEGAINTIQFYSAEQNIWLGSVVGAYNKFSSSSIRDDDVITFADSIDVQNIKPVHLVTLACLIHYLAKMGHNVYMSPNNKNIADYLLNELGFHEYFGG